MTSEAESALAAIKQQHDIITQTERLVLRPVTVSDIHPLHRFRRNPAVMTYMSTDVDPETDPWKSDSLTRMYKLLQPGFLSFAVEEKRPPGQESMQSSPVIGFVGMHRIPEVFYLFDSSIWGKGYASEALQAFVATYWTHRPNGVPEMTEDDRDVLLAYVYEGNKSSEKVATKSGFDLLARGMRNEQLQAVFATVRPGRTMPQAFKDRIMQSFGQ